MTSKLSWHLSDVRYQKEMDWIGAAGVRSIKFFRTDSEMNMAECRRRGVQEIVHRPEYPGSDSDPFDLTPERAFHLVVNTKPKLLGERLIWEGLNEPEIKTVAQAQAINRWYVRFAELLHAYGQRVAAFSFSEGNPQDLSLLRYLEEAIRACDFIALHEYHRCFGYHRKVWEALPAKKPIWITETGFDLGGPGQGWLSQPLSESAYLQLLADYDTQLMQDPYVLGAFIYQLGDEGPDWKTFSIRKLMPSLVSYVQSHGGGFDPMYTPPPVPEPTPPASAPEYWLKVTPGTIDRGQSATLEYYAEHVKAAWLDNYPLAPAVGNWIVNPSVTKTYTLKVQLVDGSYQTVTATLTVKQPTPEPPPPPPTPASDCYVDPRATWIKPVQGTCYKVKAVYFYDYAPVAPHDPRIDQNSWESQDDTRVSVKVVDRHGIGIPFEFIRHDMQDYDAAGRTDVNGVWWFDLFHGNSINPSGGDSPDVVVVGDAQIKNVSLPLSRHVCYAIIVEKQG